MTSFWQPSTSAKVTSCRAKSGAGMRPLVTRFLPRCWQGSAQVYSSSTLNSIPILPTFNVDNPGWKVRYAKWMNRIYFGTKNAIQVSLHNSDWDLNRNHDDWNEKENLQLLCDVYIVL